MPYRNKKLLEGAKGAPCFMNSRYCSYNRDETCARHSNSMIHGKGMGRKADDLFVFYGCQPCEDWYSGIIQDDWGRADRDEAFLRAWHSTMIYACNEGIL